MTIPKIIHNLCSRDRWLQRWRELLELLDLIFHSGLPRIAFMLMMVILLSGVTVLSFETANQGFANLIDSMWWAIVTITTTGYGDRVPLTLGGRIMAAIAMLSGVTVISFFTATISSIFVAKKLKEEKGLQTVMFQDHYVILGWNISGIELIETLSSHSETGEIKIVLVNELDLEKTEELQQRFKNYDIQFLKGDYTGTAVLNRAKVAKAKAVLILPEGDAPPDTADEKTVLATLAVKSINPRIKTYVQVINRQAESHVERAGADRVIVPDRFTGFLLANCALQPSIPKLLEKLISYDKDVNLNVIKPPPSFVGDTFENYFLHLKREENRILIGFVAGESILSTEDILSDDISSVDAFIQQKLLQAGHSPEELETTSINLNPPLNYIIRSIDRAVIIGGI